MKKKKKNVQAQLQLLEAVRKRAESPRNASGERSGQVIHPTTGRLSAGKE